MLVSFEHPIDKGSPWKNNLQLIELLELEDGDEGGWMGMGEWG